MASIDTGLASMASRGGAPANLGGAVAEAERLGVPLAEQLLSNGLVSEEALYRGFAAAHDLPFEPPGLSMHPRASWRPALRAGIVPLAPNAQGLRFLAAPRGPFLTALDRVLARGAGDGLAIATPSSLRQLVEARFSRAIHREAADGLAERDAAVSARDGLSVVQYLLFLCLFGALAATATDAPRATFTAVSILLGLVFAGNILFRLAALREAVPTPLPRTAIPDRDLPVYTVLVPLYRETRVLRQIVGALLALDYPLAKLDVKLLLEADDTPMREAVARLALPGAFEVIVAPPGRPRTKPRALNIGLATARGEFLVIYDAEDRPDPRQLRAAVARFRASPPSLACLQGRLVIDNTEDSWLTRLFTAEYAALFGVLLPGLARLRLPVMLGGTTNHFRVDALAAVGAWDAWNVTEDADLGLRLARSGYDVGDLPLATLEEAPAALKAWMNQRTRWMKGWMQTAAVHMRRPRRTIAATGLTAWLASLSLCLGTVATALFGPMLLGFAVYEMAAGTLLTPGGTADLVIATFAITLFAAGLLTVVASALVGLSRLGLLRLAPWLLLLPAYYLLVTVASWRALVELVVSPQQWNKTEHGLARTSRHGNGYPSAAPGPEG